MGLRIGIDARLFSGQSGGIEQVAIGLVDALSSLGDGDEEYIVLGYPRSHEWIEPYIKGPCRMLLTTAVHPPPLWKRLAKRAPLLGKAAQHLRGPLARASITLSHSDGTIEREGVQVMHFILQRAFFTSVPSLYHPHDLQHAHLPQFFSPRERIKRDLMLGSFCRQAQVVCVASQWVKQDVVRHFQLPEEKVEVVPITGALGAYPTPTAEQLATCRRKLDLPEAFALYPAQTWPHKNHLKLLEALQLLKSRGITVPLVCSGHRNEFFPTIEKRVAELGLTEQARFLGFVTPLQLQCLYRLCRCVVVPTLFEAASAPLNEAFMSGAPAACSNVTSLPEQASGGAALVFDPHDASDIAERIAAIWQDEPLRASLVARGKEKAAALTWARAARQFRDIYRRIGAAVSAGVHGRVESR